MWILVNIHLVADVGCAAAASRFLIKNGPIGETRQHTSCIQSWIIKNRCAHETRCPINAITKAKLILSLDGCNIKEIDI